MNLNLKILVNIIIHTYGQTSIEQTIEHDLSLSLFRARNPTLLKHCSTVLTESATKFSRHSKTNFECPSSILENYSLWLFKEITKKLYQRVKVNNPGTDIHKLWYQYLSTKQVIKAVTFLSVISLGTLHLVACLPWHCGQLCVSILHSLIMVCSKLGLCRKSLDINGNLIWYSWINSKDLYLHI